MSRSVSRSANPGSYRDRRREYESGYKASSSASEAFEKKPVKSFDDVGLPDLKADLSSSEEFKKLYHDVDAFCVTALGIKIPEEVVAPNSTCSSKIRTEIVQYFLNLLNSATKEELKSIKGIGEIRAANILEQRNESSEACFKTLDDLHDIGLSAKQIKSLMKHIIGELIDSSFS